MFVQHCLHERWSPEQISKVLPGTFPDQPAMRACHETIYQALYSPHHLLLGRVARGCDSPGRPDLTGRTEASATQRTDPTQTPPAR
ncbi:hypothetical protein [Micromonospora globbae]|uniref:hypothetical protein n=1 Tax=Micromonospora globbae TaxID=1894969 RepID=UPI00343DBF7A